MKYEHVGVILKEMRKERGLSLNQLGEMLDVSPSYIYRIESGQRTNPSLDMIEKFAKFFNVPITTFAHDDLEGMIELNDGKVERLERLENFIMEMDTDSIADLVKLSALVKQNIED